MLEYNLIKLYKFKLIIYSTAYLSESRHKGALQKIQK